MNGNEYGIWNMNMENIVNDSQKKKKQTNDKLSETVKKTQDPNKKYCTHFSSKETFPRLTTFTNHIYIINI